MNRVLNLGISLITLFTAAGAFAAGYQENRCAELRVQWGPDAIPNLEGGAALNVRKWTLRCYPRLRTELLNNKKASYTNPDGSSTTRDVYPVFGVTKTVPDESQEGGIRFDSSNPAGYKISPTVITNPDAAPCDLPENYSIVSFCVASCYTPDQFVLLPEGFEPIKSSYQSEKREVMTLRSGATLDNLAYEKNPVRGWTVNSEDENHAMIRIATLSGGILKVTTNHPLVDSNGQVRAARTLKVGEKLVRMDGSFDPIVEVKNGTYFGKVYNVDVASADLYRNIVVAQGFLNGSVMYQNEGVKYLNRVLLRTQTAANAL